MLQFKMVQVLQKSATTLTMVHIAKWRVCSWCVVFLSSNEQQTNLSGELAYLCEM